MNQFITQLYALMLDTSGVEALKGKEASRVEKPRSEHLMPASNPKSPKAAV